MRHTHLASRSPRLAALALLSLLSGGAALVAGCSDNQPQGPKYYQRVIQPILTASCVRGQGACHMDDGSGNAVGNLDLSSYAALSKRRDVLRRYGSYPVPLLLLKASGSAVPPIPYKGRTDGTTVLLPSQIQHAASSTISVQSSAFYELQRWLDSGATEDGSVSERPLQKGSGACRADFGAVRPDVAARLGSVDTSSPAFKDFTANVEPVLTQSCAFGTCHSAEQSDFFITCKGSGSDDASKFNFLEAQAYVTDPPDSSQILLRPLAPSGGGLSHTGGVFFANKSDATWKKLQAWVTEVGAVPSPPLSEGQKFFTDNVMPVLLQRGCALEGCHSPGAANDFKLRAGSQGFFSAYSLQTNYDVARRDFLVPDVPDVRQSRMVKKPLVSHREGGLGIAHRGGPVLQSAADNLDPAACPQPWSDASTPFCTLVEWHRRERAALLSAGKASPMNAGDRLPLVVVVRPPDADRLIDFDTYRPGADLVLGSIALGPLGAVDPASATAGGSLLDNCAGVHPGRDNVDVRGPESSYDASRVVFAMRLAATDSLDLYEVTLDGAHVCTRITQSSGMQKNGILVHNLDPMYAPDGTVVFASTRGRPALGPSRSLKYLLPQTDLWRMSPSPGGGYGAPEQMTAFNNSELSPAMMMNGQVSYTAEKASADFYQLSGRRLNWDRSDYHPLLAQRAQSPGKDGMTHPSVDYQQGTEIREGLDGNFLVVLSDDKMRGAGGTVGVFNRSVGPFEADRGEVTFLRSLEIPDAAATGHPGPTAGAYRSPFPLPDGRILASYAPEATDLAAASSVRYDLTVLDPASGARVPVAGFSGGPSSHVEAVLVRVKEPKPLFTNRAQLIFGGHVDPADPAHAVVHYPDLPMLATLLGANLRTGRFVELFRPATQVVIYESLPPPADAAQAMTMLTGTQMVFQMRRELGRAPLASDGSVRLRLPSLTPVILELEDGAGKKLFTMAEEDNLGPGEVISRGVPEKFHNSVCGGCHGSVSGRDLDIGIDPDALTGASVSLSRDPAKTVSLGP